MAFTTQYAFEHVQALHLYGAASAADLTVLAGGGLAGLGDVAGHSAVTFFDSDPERTRGLSPIAGADGALVQLAGGNLAIVTLNGGAINYRVTTATGAPVLGDTPIPTSQSSSPDVAALAGGGFAIVTQDVFTGDNRIEVRICDAAGARTAFFLVDESLADDRDPAVTGLADGGFAVAWTRTVSAQTQACYVVYGADGAVRVGPTAFDAEGDTNAGMSIVALDTGGFAIAYEDSGWGAGSHDISFARFDAGGALLGRTRATSLTGTDSQASLTALSNGMVALSYAAAGDGGSGIQLQLIDPATGNPLLAAPLVIADTPAEETGPSAAAWGLAGVAVAFKGGGFDVGAHRLVRTSGGDAADDLIVGDDAVDRLDGGSGADTLSGLANADALDGGDGDDLLSGGAGQDVLEGGLGHDTADYAGGGAVRIDLGVAGFQNTGGGGFDRLGGIENLAGGASADRLTGDASDNRLVGRDGGDTLSAGAGADTLDGGAGSDNLSGGAHDDWVLGGAGADAMSGGDGVDTLDYTTFAAGTFLDLSAPGVQNTRSAGSDTLIGFENVLTGGGADRVFGSGLGNRLETAGGEDTIKAKGGSDLILSGAGDDVISAGGGADTLVGGHGVDVLRGGAQADTFHFGPYTDSAVGLGLCDVIRDFRTSDGDRIDLGEVFGGGELIFIGAAAFTGFSLQQEVRVGVVAEGHLIQVDLTGDGVSEMDILVSNGGLSGGAADFIL